MPRVRFGSVHLYNNYYAARGNNYAIGAGLQALLVIENNYFDGVNDPHLFYDGEPTAQIVASDNTYIGVSDTTAKDTGQGSAFQPPYSAMLAPADAALKDVVTSCAGPQ
jgi:pectate lyase